ncbi:uncharacterized protein K452DRAFT_267694 [Aplosporella prunicola CBS 121167]|uniref:Rhodopsin domain-containing protein n=1 Tax=Aplosporella prunicola CBS 121167 TaxID=1176127 RepID=A0A6A6BIT5_9PEZI|nr:uncharacterized protein K452DRAFT_267694 [Aplosporella prunicola CBS 121167]KAF2143548.1 hypothetical protein K452DRAFT_267694 [Aplosporella prunicola CBS 121167]
MSTPANLYEGENLQPWSIGTVAAVTVLAFVSCVLRMLARWERKTPFGIDDWLIMLSMGLYLVVVGFIYGMVNYGMGLHANTLPMTDVVMIAKYLMVAEVLYVVNLAITKLALLCMYHRLFPIRAYRIWAYCIGAFVIAWVITIVFVFIFLCVPVKKMWYPQVPGHCVNQVATWVANAVSTIATDVAILVLPMPHVWKLQVGLVQRVSLLVIFSLGFFVVFASAYRTSVLFEYTAADSSYTLARTVGWTAIEISAGIISANLPTLRPLLRLVWGTIASTSGFSRGGSTGAGTKLGGSSNLTNSAFHRLDDNNGLRPQNDGKVSSHIRTAEKDNDSIMGDEIPLHNIKVTRDTKWSSSDMA